MKWISVKEEMPLVGETVLVTHVDETGAVEPEMDYLDVCSEYGYDYWSNYGELENVTHFCRIPELPEYEQGIVPDKYTKEALEQLKDRLDAKHE